MSYWCLGFDKVQLWETDDRWSVLRSLQKTVPDLFISVMTWFESAFACSN